LKSSHIVESCLVHVFLTFERLLVDLLVFLFDLLVISLSETSVDLLRSHDDVFAVEELHPVSNPSRTTGNSEKHGHEVGIEAECALDDASVEVHVRLQFLLNEVFVTQGNLFQLDRDVDQGVFAQNVEGLLTQFLHDACTRVLVLVDSVAEPLLEFTFVLDLLDELGHILDVADFAEHGQDTLVGSSVEGALECGRGATHAAEHVDVAGGQVADGSSAAIQLVFGVQNKQDVEDAGQTFVHFSRGTAPLVNQIQEHFGLAVVRIVLLVAYHGEAELASL